MQSGIALVLVLWMLALLSVIAGSLVFSSRTEVLMAGNLASLAQAEALADAGVYKAIHELARPQTDLQRWKGDGLTHLWNFQGAELRVTILDESAKVDLNAAPTVLLKGLFRALGVAESDADALADAVADWRDADDLRSLHGAEKADYAAAGRDYGPANAPFETIEELRQVLGMSDDLFRKLEPLVTVYSRQPGINTARGAARGAAGSARRHAGTGGYFSGTAAESARAGTAGASLSRGAGPLGRRDRVGIQYSGRGGIER